MTGTYPPTVGATQDASSSGGYRDLGQLSYTLSDGQTANKSFTPQGNGIIDEVRLVWPSNNADGVETTVTVNYAQGGSDTFTKNNAGNTRNQRFATGPGRVDRRPGIRRRQRRPGRERPGRRRRSHAVRRPTQPPAMTTRDQLTAEQVDALLRMIADSGGSPAGAMPGVAYVEALADTAAVDDPRAVAQAHREGNAPPDVGGAPQ